MRTILLLFFIANINLGFAQKSNQGIMISTAGGSVLPITPTKNSSSKDYIGFNNMSIRVNYLLNNKYGIQVSYVFNEFRAGRPNTSFLKFNRLGAAIIFNLGHINKIINNSKNFRLYTRFGIGINVIYHDAYDTKIKKNPSSFFEDITKKGNNHERIGSFDIGISPSYRISNQLYLKLDISYTQNLVGEFGFDGYWDKTNGLDFRNNYLTFSVGVNLFLKKRTTNNYWKK